MSLFKSKKVKIWSSILIVAASIAGYFVWNRDTGPSYEFMTVSRGELVQEVSVTGKVKPAQSVDLQFESSGRISSINYKAGDRVGAGATIASLENQDLQAKILAAEADVISAKAELDKTTKDYNSIGDSSVYSSLRVELENAKSNLEQVKIKAEGDLATKYNNASGILNEAMTQIEGSSAFLEYIRKTYYEGKSGDDTIKYQQTQINSKVQAVRTVFPAVDRPGTIVTEADYIQVDSALKEMLSAYQSIKTAFTFLQNQMQSNPYIITSSTDRSSINSEADSIASKLSAISTATQNIVDQKITNSKNISDANAKLSTAQVAFPTTEDILQKSAAVKQAEAALLSARSQLRKTLIVAPFAGIISKIDAERGQTIGSTTAIVSLISRANYQIEANITEVDVAKISVGDEASLTLDAYGSGRIFKARVSQIDTGATIIEGVTTYKTTLDFQDAKLTDIRPDMTANVDIQTEKMENVIAIPQRAIINRNGSKIVRVSLNNLINEQVVTIGLSGKDGLVEITSGLSEGDVIVTFVNE